VTDSDDIKRLEHRVVILEQQTKEHAQEMGDWIKSGIAHRTEVDLKLGMIQEDMNELHDMPVAVAEIKATLDQIAQSASMVSFWAGPNVRWVMIALIILGVLIAGVNNAREIAELIDKVKE